MSTHVRRPQATSADIAFSQMIKKQRCGQRCGNITGWEQWAWDNDVFRVCNVVRKRPHRP